MLYFTGKKIYYLFFFFFVGLVLCSILNKVCVSANVLFSSYYGSILRFFFFFFFFLPPVLGEWGVGVNRFGESNFGKLSDYKNRISVFIWYRSVKLGGGVSGIFGYLAFLFELAVGGPLGIFLLRNDFNSTSECRIPSFVTFRCTSLAEFFSVFVTSNRLT